MNGSALCSSIRVRLGMYRVLLALCAKRPLDAQNVTSHPNMDPTRLRRWWRDGPTDIRKGGYR